MPIDQEFTDIIDEVFNARGFEFMKSRLIKKNENVVFSPYSIIQALLLLLPGTEGNTRDEIKRVVEDLGLEYPGPNYRLEYYSSLLRELLNHQGTLDVANKIYVQQGFSIKKPYSDKMEQCFNSGDSAVFELLDFQRKPEEARLHANQFVEDQTNERIKDLLPSGSIDALTRLILVNAVYFNANWAVPFTTEERCRTELGKFTLVNDEVKDVLFMHSPKEGRHEFYYNTLTIAPDYKLQYEILGIPYENHEFDMFIMLSPKGSRALNYRSLENQGEVVDLVKGAIEKGLSRGGEVSIPKFTVNYDLKLKELLKEAGMIDAFDQNSANLQGISDREPLHVTNAFHKGFIEVHENGTEAAAATAIVVGTKSGPSFRFKADRPFTFFIRHRKTHAILFLGKVMDPSSPTTGKTSI